MTTNVMSPQSPLGSTNAANNNNNNNNNDNDHLSQVKQQQQQQQQQASSIAAAAAAAMYIDPMRYHNAAAAAHHHHHQHPHLNPAHHPHLFHTSDQALQHSSSAAAAAAHHQHLQQPQASPGAGSTSGGVLQASSSAASPSFRLVGVGGQWCSWHASPELESALAAPSSAPATASPSSAATATIARTPSLRVEFAIWGSRRPGRSGKALQFVRWIRRIAYISCCCGSSFSRLVWL
ncbi:transcription factor Sox-1-like [Stomoxys calcitrans]|uniref:transcription factor Sox-1-like n=1 Tax=Stomoxys calcitrans TaxID=35570 RepID=UPI0027E2BEEB|nr:transcription factor Sox-1-like [Stomoxys calcitrans]